MFFDSKHINYIHIHQRKIVLIYTTVLIIYCHSDVWKITENIICLTFYVGNRKSITLLGNKSFTLLRQQHHQGRLFLFFFFLFFMTSLCMYVCVSVYVCVPRKGRCFKGDPSLLGL